MNNPTYHRTIATAFIMVLTVRGVAATSPNVANAVYQLPAVAAVAEHARFERLDVAFVGKEGSRRLVFRLPEDLTAGKIADVDLIEVPSSPPSAFVIFAGDTPPEAASCVLNGKSALCLIHYQPGIAKASELEKFLRGKYQGEALIQAKLAVALSYQNEPAGILSFNLVHK